METSSVPAAPEMVAACGLYCGACRKFTQGKCPGCKENEKAGWCKIRQCCRRHDYRSCADCAPEKWETCKTFHNLVGKIFAFVFRSDRPACIRRIREVGYVSFSREMQEKGQMTIRK